MTATTTVYAFRTVLVENRIFFQIKSLSIEYRLKLKCSADQIIALKSELVSFDLLQVAIRSLSSNCHFSAPANKKEMMLKRSLMGNPIITGC